MKKLTPAKVTMMMFVMVGLLVVAYVAKSLLAVEQVPEAPAMRNIPMAISDIPAGTVVTENHIGLGPVLIESLEQDMLLNNRVIVGRVAKQQLKAATPIRAGDLYQPGELPPLEVADGMRAVSLGVGRTDGVVDGLIRPGQFVDVHFAPSAYQGDPRMQGGLTMTLFNGVRIIAINRSYQQGPVARGGNIVTLELTPEQANIGILASERGEITLTYSPDGRGNGGIAVSSADRATLDEILGLKPTPTPEPPFVTEIFRRGARSVLQFRDGRQLLDNNQTQQLPGNLQQNSSGTIDTPSTSAPQPPADVPPPASNLSA